ncbi:MAG: hypothetical protein RLZZ188_1692 [Verrucomicrobiota bacterium]
MSPRARNTLIVGTSASFAVIAGWQIAHGDPLLAGLGCGIILLWLAEKLSGVRADLLVCGGLLFGYIVGGRGFAQLSVPRLPLLVGELTLAAGLTYSIWQTSRTRVLPLRRDMLNLAVIVWLGLGLIRLPPGLSAHGVTAIRDFAMVYYALFFFLAQAWGSDPGQRRWLGRCLDLAFVVCPAVFIGFVRAPAFFVQNLEVNGVPLILIKTDVGSGLLVAGTIWLLHRNAATEHRWWLVPAAASILAVFEGNSRGGLLGLATATLLLVITGDRKLLRPLALILTTGLLAIAVYSALSPISWQRTPAYRLYEWTASITDFAGAKSYVTSDLGDKPDNNRFRMVWWRSVLDRTMSENPWWGLGFGYDLANDFRRSYYGQSADEDFTARSPHNFVLTVFGRMGVLGLIALTVIMAGLVRLVWRNRKNKSADGLHQQRFALGVGAAGIFASACFGVVLEGPMGAVVFWTALGLANSAPDADHVKSPQGSISKAEEAAV